jgi:hypothetical protein
MKVIKNINFEKSFILTQMAYAHTGSMQEAYHTHNHHHNKHRYHTPP